MNIRRNVNTNMMQIQDYDIIIVGGGASGLMLAANLDLQSASSNNHKQLSQHNAYSNEMLCEAEAEPDTGMGTDPAGDGAEDAENAIYNNRVKGLIIEKTDNLGTKLILSGGGRCNITHSGSIKDFVSAYGEAGRFLRKSLYRHNNIELSRFFENAGVPLTDGSDENDRIFPRSMHSADILETLVTKAKENGWEIRTGTEVCEILADQSASNQCINGSMADLRARANGLITVRTASNPSSEGCEFATKMLVISTGGKTLPKTGSDGAMLDIVKRLGISVVPMRSALAPINVVDYPYSEISGISIPEVSVSIIPGKSKPRNKPIIMKGDLLFTHTNFSGPVILNISRYARPGDILRINYGRTLDDLPRRLVRILEDHSRGKSGDIKTSKLRALLENDEFVVKSVAENGMVSAGGIALSEVDPGTMLISKLCRHANEECVANSGEDAKSLDSAQLQSCQRVYAIGEALDCDGITGGYNLQMCWSTACTAADDIRTCL